MTQVQLSPNSSMMNDDSRHYESMQRPITQQHMLEVEMQNAPLSLNDQPLSSKMLSNEEEEDQNQTEMYDAQSKVDIKFQQQN